MKMLKISINHDHDVPNPLEGTGWKWIDFCRNNIGYEDRSKYIRTVDRSGQILWLDHGMRNRYNGKTAFPVELYDHSGRTWSLRGEGQQDQFDTTSIAALLVWQGTARGLSPDRNKRVEIAREMVKLYGLWAEGVCYYYSIEEVEVDDPDEVDSYDIEHMDGEEVASGNCFIGDERMIKEINEYLAEMRDDVPFHVVGDSAWLAKYEPIKNKRQPNYVPAGV